MIYAWALLSLALYGAALFTLRSPAPEQSRPPTLWLTLLALAGHAAVTHLVLFSDQVAQLSLVYVINVVALVMISVVCLVSARLPTASLLLLVIPVAVFTLLCALLISPGNTEPSALSATLLVHITLSLAAYSALMLAACQSVLLAVLERRLRAPEQQATSWLPPLETMERTLVAMLWIGLTLLTAAILTGFLFLEDMFAQQVAHHIVITSLSWLVYAVFLAGRHLFGWRGLTAVRWTLVAFGLLVIGYLGSKFVLEYVLT